MYIITKTVCGKPHTVFLENAIAHYNFNTLKWPESSDTQAESFADPLNLFEEKTYNNGESSNQGLERCCEVSDIELITEDQALALSSDLAPPPHTSPAPSPVSKLSLFLSLPVTCV